MKTHKNIDGRIRILLAASDFGDLVRGGVLADIVEDGPPIEIALEDIGYDRMRELIPDPDQAEDQEARRQLAELRQAAIAFRRIACRPNDDGLADDQFDDARKVLSEKLADTPTNPESE